MGEKSVVFKTGQQTVRFFRKNTPKNRTEFNGVEALYIAIVSFLDFGLWLSRNCSALNMVSLDIYFGMFSLSLNMLYSYISIIRRETFDFWGEWTLEDMKKISWSLPSKEKKFMHGQLWGKKYVCTVQPKKNILRNHSQPIPTCSLANLSHLHTSCLTIIYQGCLKILRVRWVDHDSLLFFNKQLR